MDTDETSISLTYGLFFHFKGTKTDGNIAFKNLLFMNEITAE